MIYYGANNYPIYYGANEATIYYGNELIYPTTISGISINSSVSIPKAGGSKTVRLASESDWEILVDPAATWITSISPTGGTSGRSQITITAAENTGTTALTTTITARTTDLAYSATCEVIQNVGLGIVLYDNRGRFNNVGTRAGYGNYDYFYTFDTGITEIYSYDYDFTGMKSITRRWDGGDVRFYTQPAAVIPDGIDYNMLTTVNIDASTITMLGGSFKEYPSLTSVTLTNTSNIIYMDYAFIDCPLLTDIHLGDMSGVVIDHKPRDWDMWIKNCPNVTNFTVDALPNHNITDGGFETCTLLSVASLNSIIAALPTASGSYTLTLGATNLAKLSQAEKDVAINKGWNLN